MLNLKFQFANFHDLQNVSSTRINTYKVQVERTSRLQRSNSRVSIAREKFLGKHLSRKSSFERKFLDGNSTGLFGTIIIRENNFREYVNRQEIFFDKISFGKTIG